MHRVLIAAVALSLFAASCGGVSSDPETVTAPVASSVGDTAAGEQLYATTCSACHGVGGEGVEGLGRPFVGSQFVAGLSDDELVAFLVEGRAADHPDNTTGIAMMPRGGNPRLTDADLYDIVSFLRTLGG